MKLRHGIAIGCITALLGLGAFAGVASNQKPVEKVKAASNNVSGTRVVVEDVTGKSWTNNGVDAILDIYGITFVANSGYTSASDFREQDFYAVSIATGSDWAHVRMHCLTNYTKYEAIIPWYVASFSVKFYATENSTDRYLYQAGSDNMIVRSCSRGHNYHFKSDSNRAGWGGSNFYTDVSTISDTTGYTYEFNGIASGEHMYLNTQDLTGWEADNAKMAIYFAKSNISKNDAWSKAYNSAHTSLVPSFCWKVEGSGNNHLFECIVPQYNGQDVIWSMVIGVRCKSSATEPSWTSHNQTGDLYFNGTNNDCNMIWVNAATGGDWTGGGYLRTDASISKEERAEFYGTYFLSQMTCGGETGETAGTVLHPENWANVRDEYNQHMSTDVRGEFWKCVGVKEGSTDLETAAYRYDYIVFYKYPSSATYTDYANRTTNGSHFSGMALNPLGTYSDATSTGIVMAMFVASVVSLTAVAGFFLLKKKKEF